MNFDFIIIGSGPAGSTLARKLAMNGYKIAIIDRAIYKKPRLINDFLCPYINKIPKYYTPVYSDQLGGNSALWHGKIYLMSEREFKMDKWGFEYKELKTYSNNLANELEIDSKSLIKVKNNITSNFHYSYRSDLRNIFNYFDIYNFKNIEIFSGYSPIKLGIENGKVNSIKILDLKDKTKVLTVKNSLIFCAGGLGNPHLLLNLLLKKNKNLGKFLSDHAHVNLCKIKQSQLKQFINILKPNIKNNLNNQNIHKKEEIAQVFEYEKFFAGIQLDYKIDPLRKLRRFFLRITNIHIRRLLNFFGFFILKINGFFAKLGFFLIGIISTHLSFIFHNTKILITLYN